MRDVIASDYITFYQINKIFANILFLDRYIGLADIWANGWVLPIYGYRPDWPILSASIGVDKMLLYSSRMQTTCTRKHNEPSQDSYLAATLAGVFS